MSQLRAIGAGLGAAEAWKASEDENLHVLMMSLPLLHEHELDRFFHFRETAFIGRCRRYNIKNLGYLQVR